MYKLKYWLEKYNRALDVVEVNVQNHSVSCLVGDENGNAVGMTVPLEIKNLMIVFEEMPKNEENA